MNGKGATASFFMLLFSLLDNTKEIDYRIELEFDKMQRCFLAVR